MRRTSSIGIVVACSLLVLMMSAASASAQTQTAQSAMVALSPDSVAYEIAGTITWTFNRGNHNDVDLTGTAMSYYTNPWDGLPPTVDLHRRNPCSLRLPPPPRRRRCRSSYSSGHRAIGAPFSLAALS